MIHWELCKKFKFNHTNKWYMYNPTSVLENDAHKLLWDFNIQADHLISARQADLIMINKKKKENLQNCELCHRVKLKESDVYTNSNWCSWYSHQSIDKGTGRFRNKRKCGDHSNNCIIEIVRNTEKSPGDLKRLAVTQTPVKNHLKLMGKTLKE